MIRRTMIIEKEKLDNMLLSEKVKFLERMVEDMDDSEVVCFYVNGFTEEDLNTETVEISL